MSATVAAWQAFFAQYEERERESRVFDMCSQADGQVIGEGGAGRGVGRLRRGCKAEQHARGDGPVDLFTSCYVHVCEGGIGNSHLADTLGKYFKTSTNTRGMELTSEMPRKKMA